MSIPLAVRKDGAAAAPSRALLSWDENRIDVGREQDRARVDAGEPEPDGRRDRIDVRIAVRHGVRMNVRTNLLLPKDLVEEVDHFAGERGRSRYVAEALRARIKRDRLLEAIAATAGAWRDNPLWQTDQDVVDWVRALRAEDRDPWADQP
jgi:hypothetical protein